MRMLLQKIFPGAIAVAALGACDIPDDGYNELSGEILVPAEHLPLVVMPDDEDSACDPETDKGWGEFVAIGDTVPTIYVGLYTRPLDALDAGAGEEGPDNWRQGCGEIDVDGDPVTPPESRTFSCPVGGTTARYVGPSDEGARFEFDALQLEKGDFFLFVWLDNRCREDNAPTTSLVWDIGGPPGLYDEEGNVEEDVYDLVLSDEAVPVSVGNGGNSLDDVLVLGTALDAS